MAAADARFAKMDANGDGSINAADREAKIKERFAEMDADKNGAITEAEFVAGESGGHILFPNEGRETLGHVSDQPIAH